MNKEEVSLYNKEYYQKNKEIIRRRQQEIRLNNKMLKQIENEKYYEEHKKEIE